MARDVKGKKKGFYNCVRAKRRYGGKKHVLALLNGAGEIDKWLAEERLRCLLPFLLCFLLERTGLKESHASETRWTIEQGRLNLGGRRQITEHVNKMSVLKSVRPHSLLLWVLKELADVIVRLLSLYVCGCWKRCLKPGRALVSLLSSRRTGKKNWGPTGQSAKALAKYMKENRVIWSS